MNRRVSPPTDLQGPPGITEIPADSPSLTADALGASLGTFSESLDALRATCTVLERKCADLNWALAEANRRLTESLEEREQLASRLDSILRCLYAGLVAVDLEGRIIEFNQAAERITGYTQDRVMGTMYQDLVGRGVRFRLTPLFTMESGNPLEMEEKQILTTDGEAVPVGFSTSLVKGDCGEVLGAVEVFNDLRKWKRMEEELLRTRTLAAVGEMAAEVAQQVRNPLAGLSGFTELLARDLESDPQHLRLTERIQEGVAGVERAIVRLVESARPLQADFRSREGIPVIERVVDLFEGSLEDEDGVRLVRCFRGGEAVVRLDEEQFRLALWNLLVNAKESMPEGGTITVTTEMEPASPQKADMSGLSSAPCTFTVSIADKGQGMGRDVAENAFSPFFSTKEKRVGLGLTTVRRVVTCHGGDVRLQSAPGDGTTVTIQMPSFSSREYTDARTEDL